MSTLEDLEQTLYKLDGKGYKAYKDIEGRYEGELFDLYVDHVQGDPFAAPSSVRVRIWHDMPEWSYSNPSREIALRDYLSRQFNKALKQFVKGNRGSGKGGTVTMDTPGQEILDRTSVLLDGNFLEARFKVGLPAFGRKIAGKHAAEIFSTEIPEVVENSLFYEAVDERKLTHHIQTREDADALRNKLREQNLIAFVANQAILPRASGVDPRPLKDAITFDAPESMAVTFNLPNRTVHGMGVSEGITLVVGGGYHGKSTLLNALENGVYDHIPGDGREFVVTDPEAVKIRAEDGRSIEKVDISPFINDLPHGKDTTRFSSENASGSTSQAANTMEALEAGASALLIDEDTSATNFMIRDERMQQLVPKDREPITPYIDKARQLYEDKNVSTILVIGGSGAYFDIADKVVCMVEYKPYDMTGKAREIATDKKDERKGEGGERFGNISNRIPLPQSIDPQKGNKVKLRAHGTRAIEFGVQSIDLAAVEQLTDPSQTRAIGDAMVYAKKYMGQKPLTEVLDQVLNDIEEKGWDVINKKKSGDYAAFRKIELACALNRLRSLEVNV